MPMTTDMYESTLDTIPSVSANGLASTTTTNLVQDKIKTLDQKRQEKLEYLGANKQNANLDESMTVMPGGNLESNRNKVWNNMNAAGVQDMLSDAANQSLTRDPRTGRYYYNTTGKEYVGDTERAYMYGTKANDGSVKFGLARGDLPSSDYRYQPGRAAKEGYRVGKDGYGWDAGPDGVDTSKNYMDMLLPKNVATALEGAIHGNSGALANRKYPDYLSDESLNHASGVSEYYKSADGMLGDTSKLTADQIRQGDTNNLAEYSKLPGAQGKQYVGRLSSTPIGAVGSNLDAILGPNVPSNNIARGVGSATLNVAAKVASLIGEGAESTGELLGIKGLEGAGTAAQNAATVFQMKNTADAMTGYDNVNSQALQEDIANTIKKDGYLAALGKAVTDKRSLEVLATSTPEMVALAASVGTMAIANANNNINIGEAKAGRQYTPEEKALSAVTSIVSTYLDRAGDKLALSGMNGAKQALKSAVENAPKGVQEALAAKWGKGILSIGEIPLKLTGAASVEGGTEYLQTLGENAAQSTSILKNGFTDTDYNEAEVAGVLGAAMGTHMAAPSVTKDFMFNNKTAEEIKAELEAIAKKNAEEARSNIDATLDMSATKEVTEEDKEVETALGVDSVSRIYSDAGTSNEMLSNMNKAKYKILEDIYEYGEDKNGVPQIIGIKDKTNLKAVDSWMEEYGKYQADKNGKIPKAVQDEINYIKQANIDYGEVNPESVEEKLTTEIKKDLGNVTGKTDIEMKSDIEAQIDKSIQEYGLHDIPNIKDNLTKRVLDTYGISGMSGLGSGISVQMDKDELNSWVKDSAGLKTNLEQRAISREGKVVETGSVTNEELDAIMEGEGTVYDSAHPNTKLRERVLRHLDPLTNKNNTVNTLRDIKYSMVNTIGKNLEKAGTIFKGGDTAGNMMRLMVVAANTINGQVASDTNMRAGVDLDDSMTMKNEYWASMSSTMEQIGKDYASSYGLKLAGSPEALSKAHRAIGRFAIELLQDAGLAEVTQDSMWNRAGDVVTTDGTKLSSASTKKGVGTTKTTEQITGKEVLMTRDKGIRLTDTVARVDALDESSKVNSYKSTVGDALSRVSKLLLPNANKVPDIEYVDKDLKIDPGIKVNSETVQAIQDNMAKPVTMKSGKVLEVLQYLKGVNETKGLNTVEAKSKIKEFLGLVGTGAKLLEVNDDGKIMNRMNNIVGILDNLEDLSNSDGVHYSFQIDINDRTTIEQTVANYQGDKDYARQVMGVGRYVVKSGAEKEILITSLVDALATAEQKKTMSDLDIIIHYAKLLDTIEKNAVDDVGNLIGIMANTMESGYALGHLKSKGGLRVLSALEGARDVANAGDGPISTEYVPEKDASASGVQNTLINIAGRDPKTFKELLRSLGVKFDKENWPSEVTDAYSFLSKKIEEALGKMMESVMDGVGANPGDENLDAVKRISNALNDSKLMRNLAKYPIMTWFYSAERNSIVENLTQEMTQVLIEKAVAGDEDVLKYLSEVTGKQMTIKSVKVIEKGSKEHIALRNELEKIGDAFFNKLTEAFPQVQENKVEMQGHFKFLSDVASTIKKVTGTDYWNGEIRTALGALKGTNDTMSLYKQKNTAMNLSSDEKMSLGIATDAEKDWLVTKQEKMANVTSMLALMMHSVDSGQQNMMLEEIGDSKAILTIHDGFMARPEDLIKAQKTLERVTVDIAVAYDIMNEMAVMMRATADKMKKDLDSVGSKAKKDMEFAIKQLEGKASEIEKVNNPRMEAKAKLLENAETQLFGKEGYINQSVDSKVENKKPEEVKEEFIAKVYESILDMVEELPTMDDRKGEILSTDIKIVTLDAELAKELIKSTNNMSERKALNAEIKRGGSFTFRGTVYVGRTLASGKDEISGKKATAQQVLDTVMHEIEHAVIDKYVDTEKNGKIKDEYERLVHILDKAKETKIPGLGRVNERVKYIMKFVKDGNYEQAVKELVAISKEEEVAGDVFNTINSMAKIQGSALSRFIKSIWNKVQELMTSNHLDELLNNLDVYTIAVAVKSIQDKARGNDTAVAKADDGIMSGFSEGFDLNQFTDKIEMIC